MRRHLLEMPGPDLRMSAGQQPKPPQVTGGGSPPRITARPWAQMGLSPGPLRSTDSTNWEENAEWEISCGSTECQYKDIISQLVVKKNTNANFKTKKNTGESGKLIQIYKAILILKQTIHIRISKSSKHLQKCSVLLINNEVKIK